MKKVLVIGGRNSAIEAALEIYRAGGKVTLVHRRTGFDNKVKYWIKPDIENRIAREEIAAYFNSKVVEIKASSVRIKVGNGKIVEIENDYVLALTGFAPDTSLMKSAGVVVDEETLVPEHSKETFETNISGLYIAGTRGESYFHRKRASARRSDNGRNSLFLLERLMNCFLMIMQLFQLLQ